MYVVMTKIMIFIIAIIYFFDADTKFRFTQYFQLILRPNNYASFI